LYSGVPENGWSAASYSKAHNFGMMKRYIVALTLAVICSGVASLQPVKNSRAFGLKSAIRTPFHESRESLLSCFPFCFLIPFSLDVSQPQENAIVIKLLSKVFPLFLQKTSWWRLKNLA
jgi:hypothetical protein